MPMPEMVFAEDKVSKPHAAPAMQFFGKGDDEKAPAAPARATPPDNDDSMSLPLMFLNDGDEVAPVEPPKEGSACTAGRRGRYCTGCSGGCTRRGSACQRGKNARDAGTGG